MNHRPLTIGAILAVVTAAGIAHAADTAPSVEDIKAAESDFNKGREAYKATNYVEAAEYFESADSHAPNDRVLELAINARDKAGHIDRAATLAQYGLDTYPNSERVRKVASPLVDRGRAEMLQVTIQCDEACSLLDGTRLVHGAAAQRRVVYLTPGDHTVRAVWSDDRAVSKNVTGKAGESQTLDFRAPPIPKKVELPPPTTGTGAPGMDRGAEQKPFGLPPLYFWIGAGTTAALGGVTVWSGIDTLNNPGKDKVERGCVGQGTSCSLYKDGKAKELRTNLLIGATSVVGVATAIVGLFATDWRGEPEKEEKATAKRGLNVSPWVSYHYGPSIGATGRF
ncbi:MAG TPA: hypothetical protein VHE30_07370 [Polyangiaceae bacterium]|nr:hypothetical protein [Polyangiaceae bacterium]